MDEDKAIRAAKLTLGGMLEKRRAKGAVERAQGQIAPSKYLPGVPRAVHADGGEVADLGQAREQKQLRTFHSGMMDDIGNRMTHLMEAHQKAVDAGVFDGYELGDVLQGSAHPMRIKAKFMRQWKPNPMVLQAFDRMGAKPTIIEHEGKQYIPMLRYQTGVEGQDGFQEGDAYLDGVKAAGYQKMGSLRSVKAAGGAAMLEGIHEDLQDEKGNPLELWHGTPSEPFDEFKDAKLGSTRDYGFYGRGHYLTPDRDTAEEYTTNEYEKPGTVMGPLHAALKNPYIWDASDQGAHRTLRDLQSMGIMKGQGRLEAWDNLQRHHIDPFMREMQKRGHDGVIVRTNDYLGDKPHRVSEIVVFKPSAIKHKDAAVFDPNDPNIYRAKGGAIK
jgi:hypothetical protein